MVSSLSIANRRVLNYMSIMCIRVAGHKIICVQLSLILKYLVKCKNFLVKRNHKDLLPYSCFLSIMQR